jgi:hypothetical protein
MMIVSFTKHHRGIDMSDQVISNLEWTDGSKNAKMTGMLLFGKRPKGTIAYSKSSSVLLLQKSQL